MSTLQNTLKELRSVEHDFACMVQILTDLQEAYSIDRNRQPYSCVQFFKTWIQDKRNQLERMADKIDDELILIYKEEQNN